MLNPKSVSFTARICLLFGSNILGYNVVAEPNNQPNIILILADDLGYGDLGCYGGTTVPTPNIDRLAQTGARFTNGYVTASICAPSRAGLICGAYQQRFGMQNNSEKNSYEIPITQKLLPEILAEGGYSTCLIGKWNIPKDPKSVFNEIYSVMDWKGSYFADSLGRYAGVDGMPDEGHVSGWSDRGNTGEYLTDRITRQAVDYIQKKQSHKFFLYLAYNAPHAPFQAPARFRKNFTNLPEPLQLYHAMISSLDENIGILLKKLRELKLDENTLILFLSDNGPALGNPKVTGWNKGWKDVLMGSKGSFNGQKGDFYEGGIRIPFLFNWPLKIKPAVSDCPIISLDIVPTLCQVAGISMPAQNLSDGISLMPYLTNSKMKVDERSLYWKIAQNGAMRKGDWKMVFRKNKEPQLFNLKLDAGEKNDVSKKFSKLTTQMISGYEQWQKSLSAPQQK